MAKSKLDQLIDTLEKSKKIQEKRMRSTSRVTSKAAAAAANAYSHALGLIGQYKNQVSE